MAEVVRGINMIPCDKHGLQQLISAVLIYMSWMWAYHTHKDMIMR